MQKKPAHLDSALSFRKDINGLRAWAVIAVLLFHFSLIGLPGGFVGVDVFFVISGYLMTAIIITGHERGCFSVWEFYKSRITRILPALIVLLVTLLTLGWMYLPTIEYQELGKQTAYSLGFLSNIGYWCSAGYFDSGAHEKWLLHTWSLAVEAQFYLLYPVYIAFIWRLLNGLKGLASGLLFVFALSFALSPVLSVWEPSAAFYLLPPRGWELIAGGLTYLSCRRNLLSEGVKVSVFGFGWVGLIGSFVFIDSNNAWPSFLTVIPVFSTCLIILSQQKSYYLTDNSLLQWVGSRSYSLYLWHWPLAVALYFFGVEDLWVWVCVAFLASFFLAHFSYHLVEIPARIALHRCGLMNRNLVGFAVVIPVLCISLAIGFLDFQGRLENQETIDFISKESSNKNWAAKDCSYSILGVDQKGCLFGMSKDVPDLIFVGDSFAEAMLSAVAEAALLNKKQVLYLGGAHGCATAKGYGSSDPESLCANYYEHILGAIDAYPRTPVLIVSSARYYMLPSVSEYEKKHNLSGLVSAYQELGKDRTLFATYPIPTFSVSIPQYMSRRLLLSDSFLNEDYRISIEDYYKKYQQFRDFQEIASGNLNVYLLDPIKYICDKKYCYGSKGGRPLYFDGAHLSEFGNKLLIPMFEEIFNKSKTVALVDHLLPVVGNQ